MMQMQRNWADRPLGMRDLFTAEAKLRRKLENRLIEFFDSQGFDLVSSGAFEFVDTLLRGRSIQDAEDWVQLFDMTGRAVALRPEMTPSIARIAAPLVAGGRDEIRWCYAERVYHRTVDPASLSWASGKAAESTQVGVEWIGQRGSSADCSLLALCKQAAEAVGLNDGQMVISHAAFAPAFLTAHGTPRSALDGLLQSLTQGDYVGFRQQASAAGIQVDVLKVLSQLNPFQSETFETYVSVQAERGADAIVALETTKAAWADLTRLAAELKANGLETGLSFDLTLHRDLTYYTGIVFELFAPGVGAPIALGGRYDHLLEQFGAPAPAIGFTFELERLMSALSEGLWLNQRSPEGEW